MFGFGKKKAEGDGRAAKLELAAARMKAGATPDEAADSVGMDREELIKHIGARFADKMDQEAPRRPSDLFEAPRRTGD